MNTLIYCIQFLFVLLGFSFCLNLTILDYDNPSASHILDADVEDDLLIVSGYIGGIEFYDISDPSILSHLSTHSLSSGGGGGGGGGGGNNSKPKCVKAHGDFAYFTSTRGVAIVDVSNPSNPQNLGYIPNTQNMILENLDIDNNILAVAAHEDGVLLYDISNPLNPSILTVVNSDNAWTVDLEGDYLYVGDESVLKIFNANDFSFYISLELSNSIKDIIVDNQTLYVALGSHGVICFEIHDNLNPELIDTYSTSAMANRLSLINKNLLTVSD